MARRSGPTPSAKSAASRPAPTSRSSSPTSAATGDALQLVLDEKPEILNHNIESVPRLYYKVRPQAKYHRSLKLLQISKQQGLTTKTGMMLGIGEEEKRDRRGTG